MSKNRGKRRVLFVGDFSASKLGNHSVIEDLSKRLSSELEVYTTSTKTTKPARVLDMLSTTWRHRNLADAAVVDVFSGRAFLWAELVVKLLSGKMPIILVLRGGALPDFARRHSKRVSKLFASATQVISPSRYLGEQLGDHLASYVLIPNPIDIEQYTFRQRESLEPRLVWLRSFHKIYNPMLAPLAVSALRNDFPDVFLTMVGGDRGDGSFDETKRLAGSLGVADRIAFVGAVPKCEVSGYLASSDIFLNTTTVDNTPISLIEALASGLCVVSTDVGGVPYLVDHGENALLVPSGDSAAVVQAVSKLLTRRDCASKLSANGRKLAESCDWKVVLPQWRQVLEGVA